MHEFCSYKYFALVRYLFFTNISTLLRISKCVCVYIYIHIYIVIRTRFSQARFLLGTAILVE
jgi:hypothetical protein